MKREYNGVRRKTLEAIKLAEESFAKGRVAEYTTVYEHNYTKIELYLEINESGLRSARVFLNHGTTGGFVVQYNDGRIVWENPLPKYLYNKLNTIYNVLNKWEG